MGPNGVVASTVEQNFKQKPGCGMSSEKLWRRTFGRHQRRSVKLSGYSGGKSWVWPKPCLVGEENCFPVEEKAC